MRTTQHPAVTPVRTGALAMSEKKQPSSGTCTRTCTADAGRRTPDVGRHLYLDQAAELNIDVPVLQYVYGVAKVQDALPSDRPLTVEPQALSGLSATPI
ncbi:hypothetical protein [Immundisolibacter sp.]|uniref:hypothetical protein n=1 Tax=Immundisolibacter sp. TaxID=1934948 RepID=UPI0019A53A00|nr:hypothetical protein [Immundisolibacter sp.]MBC7163223.1 hypothetical protein [Immundisolibacter sp.]MEA3221184.1 hypothetical protein [Immundisolibacter sp.]